MRKPLPFLSLVFAFIFMLPAPPASPDWELRKEKSGIKVYTRKMFNSKIKELRMTFQTDASLQSIISLLNDTEVYMEWIYRFKEVTILKQISDSKSIYYGALDFPWPLTDRDLIAESVTIQDPVTKVVTVTTTAIKDYMPDKNGHVRIEEHSNSWTFTPLADGTIDIDYVLRSNPGGSIPSWAINMALDQGSTQSMEAFLELLKDDRFKNARTSYIID